MPFKSKSQIRKFRMLESQGKLPKGTTQKWLRHTRNLKSLPQRVGRRKR